MREYLQTQGAPLMSEAMKEQLRAILAPRILGRTDGEFDIGVEWAKDQTKKSIEAMLGAEL